MPPSSATDRLNIRPAKATDAEACGRIYHDAFAALAGHHRFPLEPGSREFTHRHMASMLAHPRFHGLVAERTGQILATAWADERAPITGIGPVVVNSSSRSRS